MVQKPKDDVRDLTRFSWALPVRSNNVQKRTLPGLGCVLGRWQDSGMVAGVLLFLAVWWSLHVRCSPLSHHITPLATCVQLECHDTICRIFRGVPPVGDVVAYDSGAQCDSLLIC